VNKIREQWRVRASKKRAMAKAVRAGKAWGRPRKPNAEDHDVNETRARWRMASRRHYAKSRAAATADENP